MDYQLRVYRLHAGALDDFVTEWRSGVLPLREQFGFTVVGAWGDRETDRFAWILAYQGAEGFEQRDSAYYASPERASLDPDPARHIEATEAFLMRSVL